MMGTKRPSGSSLSVALVLSLAMTSPLLAQSVRGTEPGRPASGSAPSASAQNNPYFASNAMAGENVEMVSPPGSPGAILAACRARDAGACRTMMADLTRRDSWTDCGTDVRCPSRPERQAMISGCNGGQAQSCDLIASWASKKGYDAWKARSD
jgi:hypothetical protein